MICFVVNLSIVVLWYDDSWLAVWLLLFELDLLSSLFVLLFEYGCALSLPLDRILIDPCKLVGLLPFMYNVYIGLSFLCVTGEWYLVK